MIRVSSIETVALTIAIVLPGCGDDAGHHASSEVSTSEAIKSGEAVDEPTAVVSVINGEAGKLCTGTLIFPNVVLTAGHCVGPTTTPADNFCDDATLGAPSAADSFRVSTASDVDLESGRHEVAEVLIPYAPDTAFCAQDLALLLLSAPISTDEATPIPPRVAKPAQAGETYDLIGFGGIDDDGTGSGIRRRRNGNEVVCVGTSCPTAPNLPTVLTGEWLGGHGTCVGDSGSPALASDKQVIGVTSRGLPFCTNAVYTSTHAWRVFIADSVSYAAGLAELPVPAWAAFSSVDPTLSAPVGAPCATGGDCYTSICVPNDDGGYCSRSCSENATCPLGYECAESQCEQTAATTVSSEPGGCAVAETPASTERQGWGLLLLLCAGAVSRRARTAPRRHGEPKA